MGKIMKPGRAVLVLSGRCKAIVVKNYDEGTSDKPYDHSFVTGIDRYPRKVHKRMGKNKIHQRSKINPFVKLVNCNHLKPTRYTVDFSFEKFSAMDLKNLAKRKKFRFNTRVRFEERYKSGRTSGSSRSLGSKV